jgi:hypothetical protein
MDTLVGIPAKESSRRGTQKVNSAELLYIHTNGSPVRGIPARPVIEPAIAAPGNREQISVELKDAAKSVLNGDETRAMYFLNRAGIAGMNAAKQWFFDARNNWAPLKPATIARKGSSQPLIDTAQMRRSITWVVRRVR